MTKPKDRSFLALTLVMTGVMRGKIIASLLAAATVAFGSYASAAVVEYHIDGASGTGVLNGTGWSGPFEITMVGDNSTVMNNPALGFSDIDPLVSASVTISGIGTATFSIPTKFGINPGDSILFF
jgi:hypothetical protein